MDTTRTEHDALLASQLAEHLDYLRRFARSRARDEELAEEAVQETLLAALESGQRFAGRARLRTWLTGILIHKIHDEFRRGAREATVREPNGPDDTMDFLQARAADSVPSMACEPDRALHCRQLRAAIARSLDRLPLRQKEVFLLKEISGLETEQIVDVLGLSTGNVWVLLHRARTHMQSALAREGFSCV
jgi:RNA polymerase sigma-70 factor (ECF subfamily)